MFLRNFSIPTTSSGYAGSESEHAAPRSVKSVYNIPITQNETEKSKQAKLTTPVRLFKRLYSGATVNAENSETRVIETNEFSRAQSVVDTRLDIKGSLNCFQSDDESYFQNSDNDDDYATESELSQSANSRTLILPNSNSQKGELYQGKQDKEVSNHPHTPPALFERAPLSKTNLEKHNYKCSGNALVFENHSNLLNEDLQYLKSLRTRRKSLELPNAIMAASKPKPKKIQPQPLKKFNHARSFPSLK